jgi:hypothetical protein
VRRRRQTLAAVLALALIAVAWSGREYRQRGSGDAPEAQATQVAPVPVPVPAPGPAAIPPVSAPREARPAVASRKVQVRPVAPAAPAPPPRPPRVSLKLAESIASLASAAPVDVAPTQDAPTAGPDRRYLVFVNPCDGHDPAGAEYRGCRAAEVRRLAFACGFYQREQRTVAYARARDAEGWKQAYCHTMDAYKAAAR